MFRGKFKIADDFNAPLPKEILDAFVEGPSKEKRESVIPNELGWETGFEPATFGATDRRSTS
jgi:hypothetical protein